MNENEKAVLEAVLKGAGLAINAVNEEHEKRLTCPITSELFKDPVICAGDGQTYEREAIEKWFSNNSKSPLTRVNLTEEMKVLVPNFSVREACNALRKGPQPEGLNNEIPMMRNALTADQIETLREDLADELADNIREDLADELADNIRDDVYSGIFEEVHKDLEKFWKAFKDHFNDPADQVILYPRIRRFRMRLERDLRWIVDNFDPKRRCRNCRNRFLFPDNDGPEGIHQTFRVTGEFYIYIWNIWVCCEGCRDAFHAQLPPNHPIITGEANGDETEMEPEYDETERITDPPALERLNLGM